MSIPCKVLFVFIIISPNFLNGEIPKFRVLAPEFICPKDEDTPIDKPDNTVITLQTAVGSKFDIVWRVRWAPLQAPPQRLTLMLWRTVRALETKLNSPQPDPYVYVIDNNELLHGVKYVFTITAVEPNGEVSSPKTFHIDNTQGDRKLDLDEGSSDLMSVVLVGPQRTYADVILTLEAQVTSCFPTQDYYFIWTIRSSESGETVDVSQISGSRLKIPPYSLRSGWEYDVHCQVIKHSTGLRIAQTGLLFQVARRGLEMYLNVDYLVVPVNEPFVVETTLVNHDYDDTPVTFKWECIFAESPCKVFENTENETFIFPNGLSDIGIYEIKLSVSASDQAVETSAIIKVVEHTLPVLQITPMSRILNEDSKVTLVANASNVAPTCSLTWYFAKEGAEVNNTCEDCQHGEALSDTLTVYSLEENFLNELTDFTNETEWRQVSGEMAAASGRARFVAQCGCSATFDCETKGTVYADVTFILNESPKAGGVKISPELGSAMETIFRISTQAVDDPDTPLKYSFYCRLGEEDTLLLGSFVEHLAVETFLPYVEEGTEVWVEVCDARGACATGESAIVALTSGDGTTVDMLIEDIKGLIRRCELTQLASTAIGAIVTYTNADQQDLLTRFSSAILAALPPDNSCVERQPKQYTGLLHGLARYGVDTSTVGRS